MVNDLDLDHHRLLITLGKSLSTCPQCCNNEGPWSLLHILGKIAFIFSVWVWVGGEQKD